MSLRGKVAVVTGSANGIGREIARRMGQQGADVLVVDVEAEGAQRTVSEIKESGGSAELCIADVGDRSAAAAIVAFASERFGSVDILVNNAAAMLRATFLETSLDAWDQTMAVNLTGAFLCAQAAAKVMVEKKWGRIVNISSHAGQLGSSDRTAYTASKGGLEALTRAMATELAPHGITVNAVAPGSILTRRVDTLEPARLAAWQRSIPMKRQGNVGELAAVAVFLASEEASYLTGQTIAVDGGFTTVGLIVEH